MKLFDLIKNTKIVNIYKKENLEVKGITADSRKVEPGFIFVAIRGYKTNGENFIPMALKNGAIAIVAKDYFPAYDILQIQVENPRQALSSMASSFYDKPSSKLRAIGITATNGKTSTSFMLKSIFDYHQAKTGIIGTVFVKYGDFVEPAILTTPESVDLQKHIYNMVEAGVTDLIMEVSSSALELHRTDDVDFDIVSFNNISNEHLDLHGSFQSYYDIKSRLVTNLKEDSYAVLNLDCEESIALKDKTKAQVLSFGVENKTGDLYIENLDLSSGFASFDLVIGREINTGRVKLYPQTFRIELSVPGYHSVVNSMSAIAMAILSGIPIPSIQKGLGNFKGVERRFEFIYDDDFKIIDDHFANVGNIDVTLKTLSMMDYKDLKFVYAIRGSRGVKTNRENAVAIAKWAPRLGIDRVIATTSRSNVMEKDMVLDEELKVFKEVMDQYGLDFDLYEELGDAVEAGLKKTGPNDILLLAGCQGMDFGGQIALEKLASMRPDLNREDLFKPLENRVVGKI